MSSLRVAVAGATGYSGQELLRRLARHPHARVVAALGSAATDTPRRLPALARIWDGDILPFTADAIVGHADAAFLALPEEAAASIAPMLAQAGVRVFDLSGAFRLRDAGVRARWYPATPDPLPPHTLYALPEFTADSLPEAQIVSCPGCYPTAALLALAPLARAGLLASHDVIVDAKSGISGAGKGATERTHFSENHGSVAAYKAFAHRHTPEIEQELVRTVTFVPHLVPLDRGILCTTYTRVTPGTTAATIAAAFDQAYDGRPFVRVTGTRLPEIKHVVHSNFCDVGWALDVESHRLVVVSVIDNLVKGAAGQAIQNYNLAYGLDEREGLL